MVGSLSRGVNRFDKMLAHRKAEFAASMRQLMWVRSIIAGLRQATSRT